MHEDTLKYYFILIDFRKATNHFADPDFNGEPVQIYEPGIYPTNTIFYAILFYLNGGEQYGRTI